ncbi:Os10g0569600 [Oryza sativa Japonica Group]|uniref:Os10g0569600 protein n=2 Tax=Oryza sativa subsp. japonica TaxID=39947 RepID=A0A0P0XXT6_ORYSJ|nr:putative pathogen-related protein Rir1b [Oryza sativa Japonica Group]EAZ17041.1 hypothetical protein OsJ_32531 [Oryza sativa Japonica Group]KAF2914910.1 hypothetical protein DAI22_10g199400 [Oryza sativa Japonica Group]BAF27287.1 Os10g0569600 [Oryza sativa Japonica Group]BAT12149.1 Os10g0569600 [Oryza sativa Japonica Group]|eukprot:NP_001065450.1 Os10g0569600 [Oryza sativa Japonica Group]
MRTQRSYLCKVLLMVLALICTLHTASVQGGRAGAADAIGRNGALNPPRYPVPRIPGEPYTRPGRGCTVAYGCYGGPPAAKP